VQWKEEKSAWTVPNTKTSWTKNGSSMLRLSDRKFGYFLVSSEEASPYIHARSSATVYSSVPSSANQKFYIPLNYWR
jgi:hypothetical protein